MKKNVIRLSESQLKNIVAKSTKSILKEYYKEEEKFPPVDIYEDQFKGALSHIESAMKILEDIDPSDFEPFENTVDEKLYEMYKKLDDIRLELSDCADGDYVLSLYPKYYSN